MTGFARPKRVTDPLGDKVKARLIGGDLSDVSSGSEHSSDRSSPCLSELVHSFLEDDQEAHAQPIGRTNYESDSDRVDTVHDCTDAIEVILKSTSPSTTDSYRSLVVAHVLKAMEVLSCYQTQKLVFRRKVMAFLRDLGHNAAICKTNWTASGGLAAGNHEFIDVVQSPNRYLVDLDFASEFEIARPTSEYSRLWQSLPRVFVGKSEELKKIVKVMSGLAKRSLKSRELSLPPWRKNRYMQNKWLGPYRRTANEIPTASLTPSAAVPPVSAVKCRFVGFDEAVNGRLFVRIR